MPPMVGYFQRDRAPSQARLLYRREERMHTSLTNIICNLYLKINPASGIDERAAGVLQKYEPVQPDRKQDPDGAGCHLPQLHRGERSGEGHAGVQ